MKSILIALLLTPILSLAASESDFLGKWKHEKYESRRIEVEKNGNAYLLTIYREKTNQKFPAVLSNQGLQITSGQFSTIAVIEKKTGMLVYNGQSFRRLNKGESFDYKEPQIPRF